MIKRTTPVEERLQCVADVRGYLSDLIKTKEAAPTDDLLGRQISKQREDGTEDHEELVALAFLLLLAGHETTANMISLGTLTLIDKPETRAAIVEDPSRTPGAIEELLRYFTIVETATSRVATADIEVGGTLIRKGEGVVAIGSTANRDPSAFPNPDELDIERGARHHVAFGFGPHQCLGQNLARAELQIVFDTLFKRIPDLKLAAPISELPFKDDANIYGLYALPVTW
jgi:cytochrome P450